MKNLILFTLFFLIITLQFSPAQPPDTLWSKTYGEGIGQCIIETSDSCYVVVGHSFWGGGDLRLIKTDSDGDTIWTKTYGDTNYIDQGHSVRETADNGFIIVGSTSSFSAGKQDIWLLKTDEYGDTLWTKTFGGDSTDIGRCVQITNDGGFIIVGSTTSFGMGREDVWLIKTDEYGDTLWTKTYGDSLRDRGNYVIQTSDSGYAIVGSIPDFNFNVGDSVWFAKTNANGDSQMIRTYKSDYAGCIGRCILETNNGYLISYSVSGRGLSGGLIRTDYSGDTLWTRHTEGSGRFILRTFNGDYLTGGNWDIEEGTGSNIDMYDENGNIIMTVWREWESYLYSLIQSSDGSFVFTGYRPIYNPPQSHEISITKLGTITSLKQSNDNLLKSFSLSQNYPNPFNPTTTIAFDLPKISEVTLKVFNILGEEVATLVSDRLSAGSYSYKWNASNLASGVYLYRLEAGGFVETKKMILMK